VIFNEDKFFSGDIKDLKDDLLYTSTAEFAELLKNIALLETRLLGLGRLEDADALPETTAEDDAEFIVPIGLDIALDQDSLDRDFQDLDPQEQELQDWCIQDDLGPYPTPEQTPPVALLAYSIQQMQEPIRDSQQEQGVWQSAFHAGRLSAPIGTIAGKPVDKAQLL
jgi:hypothetical protein